jgi:CheY-like chemotaxis protein
MTDVVRALEELKRTTHLSDARPSMAGACSLGMTVDFGDLGATGGEETRAGNDLVQPAQEVAAGLAGRTVVIVEPSRTQAGFIRRYLDQLKINVAKAVTSGQEALAAAKECRADAIINAMHLADMTGVQLAKVLAADPACADIGFILATSETDGNPIAELPTARAVVVLSKPFDVTSLTRAVAQAISHRAVTCD